MYTDTLKQNILEISLSNVDDNFIVKIRDLVDNVHISYSTMVQIKWI